MAFGLFLRLSSVTICNLNILNYTKMNEQNTNIYKEYAEWISKETGVRSSF